MNNSPNFAPNPIVEYELITNFSRLNDVLSPLIKARVIAIDTETTGLDPLTERIRLIQIAVPHPNASSPISLFHAIGSMIK